MDLVICIQYFLYTNYVFSLRMDMIITDTYKTVRHIPLCTFECYFFGI